MEKLKIEKKGIKNEWMNKSLIMFKGLTIELLPNIKKHKYDIIIGEDCSGRIPGLVIGGLIKKIYENDGVKKPNLLFLTGYRGLSIEVDHGFDWKKWENNLLKYFKYLKENNIVKNNSKVLLVSEYVFQGRSLIKFKEFFKKIGIEVDFAVVEKFDGYEDKVKVFEGNRESSLRPVLWDSGRKGLKMLEKDFSKSSIISKKPENSKNIQNLKNIKEVRDDIKIIIEDLFNWYYKLLKIYEK